MKLKFLFRFSANWLLLIILVCTGLASCQSKYDPMGAIGNLADQNIPRTYSVVIVDTPALASTIFEYELIKGGTGTFLTSTSGNGKDVATTEQPIMWSRGEYVDNNVYATILIDMVSGNKTLKWSSNTVFDGDLVFSSRKRVAGMTSVYKQFSNSSWKTKSDTARYLQSVKYLGWDQALPPNNKLTQDEIDDKRAYLAQQWVKDTIAWFNKTFDKDVPDTIKVGKFDSKTEKYTCVFYVGSEKTMLVSDMRPLAEKKFATSTFVVTRDAGTFLNQGQYCYHCFEQDSAHYLNPTAANANAKDSLYQFDIKGWCIGSVSGVSEFNLVAKGDLKHVAWRTVNGHRDTLINVVKSDVIKTFAITEHDPQDMATIDGVWHKYVQK